MPQISHYIFLMSVLHVMSLENLHQNLHPSSFFSLCVRLTENHNDQTCTDLPFVSRIAFFKCRRYLVFQYGFLLVIELIYFMLKYLSLYDHCFYFRINSSLLCLESYMLDTVFLEKQNYVHACTQTNTH